MSEGNVNEIASYLLESLAVPLGAHLLNPSEPFIVMATLKLLMPDSASIWGGISHLPIEQQWSVVLKFIQTYILDGSPIQFSSLQKDQLLQIYLLLAGLVEQQLQQPQQQPSEHLRDINGGLQRPKSSSPLPYPSQKRKKQIGTNHSNKKKQLKDGTLKGQDLKRQLLASVQKVKHTNLQKNRPNTNVLFRDPKGTQAVAKADRQFKYFLKQYQREGRAKLKSNSQLINKPPPTNQLESHFLKVVRKKQKDVQQTMTNQQLKYFLTLRERKVAFINKIHRLTQQLQRERQVDYAQQQRQLMEQQRQKVQLQVDKTQGLFQTNIDLLKEQYQKSKKDRGIQKLQELKVCRDIESKVRKQKMGELDLMQVLWEQENTKLSVIMGDEERTKNKLIQIYRQHRP